MKRGCLLVLLVWVVATGVLCYLLKQAGNENAAWIGLGIGLGITISVSQIWGLLMAVKKMLVINKPELSWSDGAYVGVSGKLDLIEKPILSPISKRPFAILEYEVKREQIGSDGSSTTDFQGFHMAPCGIRGSRGLLRLYGFPILQAFPKEDFAKSVGAQQAYHHYAQYICTEELKTLPNNPIALIKELSAVLSDEDGVVASDFMNANSAVRPKDVEEDLLEERYPDDDFDEDDSDDDDLDDDTLAENADGDKAEQVASPKFGASQASQDSPSLTTAEKAANIRAQLPEAVEKQMIRQSYALFEQGVRAGDLVTAFGTYHAKDRAIEVGSGLQKVSHSLKPGSAAAVLRSEIIRGVICLLIFGGASFAASCYVFPNLKDQALQTWEQLQQHVKSLNESKR